MTENKVKVKCPECDNPEADFLGFFTISGYDEKKLEDVITHQNHYKCLGCKQAFTKERTDSNKHDEFIKT